MDESFTPNEPCGPIHSNWLKNCGSPTLHSNESLGQMMPLQGSGNIVGGIISCTVMVSESVFSQPVKGSITVAEICTKPGVVIAAVSVSTKYAMSPVHENGAVEVAV